MQVGGDEIEGSSDILPPGLHLDVLSMGRPGSARIFQEIEPSTLRDVTLLEGWSLEYGMPFLSLCKGLRKLWINIDEPLSNGDLWPVGLPLLQTLYVHGPVSHLQMYFESLLQLVLLTIACNFDTLNDHDLGRKESTLHKAILPRLCTLTVTHSNLETLIPTLKSSPHITALHLHGMHGFNAIVKYLL